ncbi:signal peptidase I [Candidatus Gracilibacteria bacterium]|nr:signal peptidase I [Candidatus Gracilibacteria bacterium]
MIKEENQSWKSFFIELSLLIAVVLFVRFYIFQIFRISGPSMCPTLNWINNECENGKGEFVFVNELFYHFQPPNRGDIIIFKPPGGKVYFIKRIMGIPGDKIEIKNGKVYLSNTEVSNFLLPESFLSGTNKSRTAVFGIDTFEVPEDHYLVFGDNRAKSSDSRQCFSSLKCNDENSPYLPRENIRGKAEFIIWPFWRFRWIENEFDELFGKK